MSIGRRKDEHLELCAREDVGFAHKSTLLEAVELLHDALPGLADGELDTRVVLFEKTLRAPIVLAGMTGGSERAASVNHQLARIAEECGYGFGLGSQRPMLACPDDASYLVRSVAPTTLLLGNLGAVQARLAGPERVAELARAVGADAMCIHLNVAQELVQPGGDRDFSGLADTFAELVVHLPIPVVAKETGCGLSPRTAARLASLGVRHVDVSGAGGTSWVAVETLRAREHDDQRALGELLRDWGIPTAAAISFARAASPSFETVLGSGGIQTGLDAARAIALGADAVAIARPVLIALDRGGPAEARAYLQRIERELRAVMLLTGSRSLAHLRRAPRVLGPTLRAWLTPLSG
ncbi:MAG: type 2 isopentenyl-diphosphate Delta-isomerase [Myxococcales bacterium]|nr:type 2 isopentenyl-diphosphate Delta-isomerase [Myxococcales bacterium]